MLRSDFEILFHKIIFKFWGPLTWHVKRSEEMSHGYRITKKNKVILQNVTFFVIEFFRYAFTIFIIQL